MAELYRHFDKQGALLYVGISVSTMRRLAQHKSAAAWFSAIAYVEVEHFTTRAAAQRAEIKAIKKERPRHNLTHSVVVSPPAVKVQTRGEIDTMARRAKLHGGDASRSGTRLATPGAGLSWAFKGKRERFGSVWVGKLITNGARAAETTLGASERWL